MSLSHNTEAEFAASELARLFTADAALCYHDHADRRPTTLSASATHEPSSTAWPKADGLVMLVEGASTANRKYVAVEYKRPQEGIHGLLTGLGQAHAYLHKGYNGAALVVPRAYPTLPDSATYVANVLDAYAGHDSIGVFGYDEPDTTNPAPFAGRLHCVRPMTVAATTTPLATTVATPRTQWVHMREGSTTRDAFLRFLQIAKRVTAGSDPLDVVLVPELRNAIARVTPAGTDPLRYLSSTSSDTALSRIWREFWFEWLATQDVLTPWVRDAGKYQVPSAFTRILKDDGSGYSQLFEGRANSLKNCIANQLNQGLINEDQGWDAFVRGLPRNGGQTQGVHQRAHSYREDLDSALLQLALIEPDGHPTDAGYHYTALCERFGGANSTAAKEFIGAVLLQNGGYGAFLHYVHRWSEQRFAADPLAFTEMQDGRPVFSEDSYWNYLGELSDYLAVGLQVMRRVGTRARPRIRTPFQVELTLLRRYGFVDHKRYRLGIGLPIDWIKVQEAMALQL